MRKTTALVMASFVLSSCQDAPTTPTAAPRARTNSTTEQQQSYIVLFKPGAQYNTLAGQTLVSSNGGTLEYSYTNAVQGFSAKLPEAGADAMRNRPDVAIVEADAPVHIVTVQSPTPSWGLDRIDQANLPLSNSYTYTSNGTGVTVYIIDTGIRTSHVDFGARAQFMLNTTGDGINSDCNGHGTHVAGTVGGTTYGVAKNVQLRAVKVLDCSGSGSNAGVIAGIDWVTQHATKPAVANMSLGGGFSSALNLAVQNSITSGVTYGIAAGNSNGANACNESPGSTPAAITVGSTTITDARSSFSNIGTCVDIFAPGSSITSAWGTADNAINTISGTSMATPHVVGVVALYLQSNPLATPAQVATALINASVLNKVTNPGTGSPNRLLQVIPTGGPVNQSPTATITAPNNNASFAQGASVAFAGTGSDPEDGALTGASLVWTSSRDGQIGTGTSFSKTNLTVGTHTITLTAKDAQNATGTATRTITITGGGGGGNPPVANFTFTCPALQCTFDASTSTDDVGIVTYGWNWGNGKSESRTTPVVKNTFVAGTYSVTLTVTDGGGLTNSIVKSVTVPGGGGGNQSPTATITLPTNLASFVQGASVSFAGTGSDPEDGALSGASLVWTSSINGQIGTGTSFNSTTLSVGTHTITLTAKDAQNATGTATRTITITAPNQAPTATITLPTNLASFVQGASVSFAGTGSDPEDGALSGASLVWTSSINGQIGTGTSFNSTSLSIGVHTITLTAKDAQNAIGTATRTITITAPVGNQPPVASFTFTCSGLNLHQCSFNPAASSDDNGIVSYLWNWGNGRTETRTTNAVVKNTWNPPGTFTISLTVTDAQGLTNTVSQVIIVP